jgi:hypothetical protein
MANMVSRLNGHYAEACLSHQQIPCHKFPWAQGYTVSTQIHKKYIVSTQVVGTEGSSYSAYFGVAFF